MRKTEWKILAINATKHDYCNTLVQSLYVFSFSEMSNSSTANFSFTFLVLEQMEILAENWAGDSNTIQS